MGRCDHLKDGLAFEKGQHGRHAGERERMAARRRWGAGGRADRGWSDAAGGIRRRSGLASLQAATRAVAGRPGFNRHRREVGGGRSDHGVDIPAQQITFSKSMNWALSLPGACLPLDQSAPGRPMLTHLPPLTGSMI